MLGFSNLLTGSTLKDTEVSSRLEKLLNLGGELSQLVKDNEELRLRSEFQVLACYFKEQTIYDDQRNVWLEGYRLVLQSKKSYRRNYPLNPHGQERSKRKW